MFCNSVLAFRAPRFRIFWGSAHHSLDPARDGDFELTVPPESREPRQRMQSLRSFLKLDRTV